MPALTLAQAAHVRERFGTPSYVYDREGLEAAARRALAFPAPFGFTLRYAMKANPSRGVLTLFRELGLHVDASSDHEVDRALRAGFAPTAIQLTSQMPSPRLAEHLARGVLYNACSLHQLEAVGRSAPGREISVRMNPGLGSGATNRTNTGGPASSFGIWHEYLGDVKTVAERFDLRITRLHSHVGSGTDPEVWKRCTRMTLDLAAKLPDVQLINLGGGFKVGRMPGEPSVEMADVGAHVRAELLAFRDRDGRALHLELEPGTYLVANAGVVVATCIDVVDTGRDGYLFAKLDAGMPEVTRPSLYGAQHPIDVLATGRAEADVVFVGPCCESGDILTPAPGDPEALAPRRVPRPQIGDLVLVGGAGAYCAAMSTVNYNSYPQAPEIMREPDGALRLLRRRQRLEQVWENEVKTLARAGLLVAIAAIYVATGKLGLYFFAFAHASASIVWLPSGIALAAILVFGRGVWPAIFVAAFLVNVTTAGSAVTSLAIAAGNALEGLVGARLVARFAGGAQAFERAADAFTFLVVGVLPAAAVSATIGVTSLTLTGYAAWSGYGAIWSTWWLGNVAGAVVLTPAVLLWHRQRGLGRIAERPIEAAALLVGVIGAAQAVFGGAVPFATKTYPLAFLSIPGLLWAAFRFGPREAATVLLVMAAFAAAGTLHGVGAFAVGTPVESFLLLQAFLVTMGVMILPVATLVWDRRRDEAERASLLGREQSARAEAEERRRVAEELAGTARSFTETLNVADVGARVVEVVIGSFGARASGLRLLASDGSLMGVAFAGGMRQAFSSSHALAGGNGSVSGLAVAGRAAAWTDNVFTDPRLSLADDVRRGMTAAGDGAVLAVPLRVKGQIIGALSVADRVGRQFTAVEVGMLQAFADQAAVAVENARLYEEAMRQRHESEVVAALAAEINRSLDLDHVLQQVAEATTALCHGDVTHIALSEPGSDAPRLRLAVGARIDADPDLRLGLGKGLGGRVLTTGRPLRTPDAREDPRIHPDHRRLIEAEGIRSGMVVPVLGEGRVEGLIYVSRRAVAPFSEHDETICRRLADHAAIAIRNSRLFAAERAARAEAHAANRAKDHFLATLSHELRTPLNAVMGWLRMLRNPRLDEAQKAHAIDVIERNARLQAQLINDLLDVSRIIAGKLEMERYPVDLVPVVQDAVEGIRGDVEAKALTLSVSLDPATGEVLGEPMRLQQVVANLLSNAVKFTPPQGCVEVRLGREGVNARLSVADSGEGIEPRMLPHVFEPFQQADSTTTRVHQGLGLGLAIVRQLVEAHGGRARAESAGRGQGATFVVELPIIALREPRAGAGPASREGLAGAVRLDGLRVLVVDDHGDARELLGMVLRERGAEVLLAAGVSEALEVLAGSAVDVLVSDLAMPGADGYALIEAVRATQGTAMPALALTAYAGRDVRERALAAGFTAHATKPVNSEDLVELIRTLPRVE